MSELIRILDRVRVAVKRRGYDSLLVIAYNKRKYTVAAYCVEKNPEETFSLLMLGLKRLIQDIAQRLGINPVMILEILYQVFLEEGEKYE